MTKKLSAREVADIVAAYRAGEKVSWIARQFGVCENTVMTRARQAGEPPRYRESYAPGVLERRLEQIAIDRAAGTPIPETMHRLGITNRTYYKALRMLGDVPRRRGGRKPKA